jgi:hypothetical protein
MVLIEPTPRSRRAWCSNSSLIPPIRISTCTRRRGLLERRLLWRGVHTFYQRGRKRNNLWRRGSP